MSLFLLFSPRAMVFKFPFIQAILFKSACLPVEFCNICHRTPACSRRSGDVLWVHKQFTQDKTMLVSCPLNLTNVPREPSTAQNALAPVPMHSRRRWRAVKHSPALHATKDHLINFKALPCPPRISQNTT